MKKIYVICWDWNDDSNAISAYVSLEQAKQALNEMSKNHIIRQGWKEDMYFVTASERYTLLYCRSRFA